MEFGEQLTTTLWQVALCTWQSYFGLDNSI